MNASSEIVYTDSHATPSPNPALNIWPGSSPRFSTFWIVPPTPTDKLKNCPAGGSNPAGHSVVSSCVAAASTMHTYRGFARARLAGGACPEFIESDYYTGRGRESFGEITLRRTG